VVTARAATNPSDTAFIASLGDTARNLLRSSVRRGRNQIGEQHDA